MNLIRIKSIPLSNLIKKFLIDCLVHKLFWTHVERVFKADLSFAYTSIVDKNLFIRARGTYTFFKSAGQTVWIADHAISFPLETCPLCWFNISSCALITDQRIITTLTFLRTTFTNRIFKKIALMALQALVIQARCTVLKWTKFAII